MKVKVLKPFGRFRTVGEVIELPHRQARTLVAIGRATQDLASQRPKRVYRRRDMVAEQAPVPVADPVVVTKDAPTHEPETPATDVPAMTTDEKPVA